MSTIVLPKKNATEIEAVEFQEEPTSLVIEAIKEYEKETALSITIDDSPDSDWSILAHQVVGHENEL